jgi:putative hydrolase of the HAD superfamily
VKWGAVFFDLDDTLIDRRAALRQFCAELSVRHPALAGRDLLAELQALDGGGSAPRDEFAAAAVRQLELPVAPAVFLEEFFAAMAAFARPWPEAAPLLERIGARTKVAVVTNGGGRTQRGKLAAAGLAPLVQEVFVSGELGVAKPDPKIFARALAWAGCAPERALFVGDDPLRDIAGAARAGMVTAWMAPGRTVQSFPAGLPAPHHVLSSLAALAAVVP